MPWHAAVALTCNSDDEARRREHHLQGQQHWQVFTDAVYNIQSLHSECIGCKFTLPACIQCIECTHCTGLLTHMASQSVYPWSAAYKVARGGFWTTDCDAI